jgi:hypothetical protein
MRSVDYRTFAVVCGLICRQRSVRAIWRVRLAGHGSIETIGNGTIGDHGIHCLVV